MEGFVKWDISQRCYVLSFSQYFCWFHFFPTAVMRNLDVQQLVSMMPTSLWSKRSISQKAMVLFIQNIHLNISKNLENMKERREKKRLVYGHPRPVKNLKSMKIQLSILRKLEKNIIGAVVEVVGRARFQ